MRDFYLIMMTAIITMLLCVALFPIDKDVPQWYQEKYQQATYVVEFDTDHQTNMNSSCLDFYDTVVFKYEMESKKHMITWEMFLNDYDFITELAMYWDSNECLCNQPTMVWSLLK